MTSAQKTVATNLCDKQLSGYAFISLRSVGDQPGQRTARYLRRGRICRRARSSRRKNFKPATVRRSRRSIFRLQSRHPDYGFSVAIIFRFQPRTARLVGLVSSLYCL